MTNLVIFFKEVRQELSRVTWPSFPEFIGTTVVVLCIIAAFAVYLGVIDFGFRVLSEYLYAQ